MKATPPATTTLKKNVRVGTFLLYPRIKSDNGMNFSILLIRSRQSTDIDEMKGTIVSRGVATVNHEKNEFNELV